MTGDSKPQLHMLIAIDGSEHSLATVHWMTQIGADTTRLRCTLLNVQKPVMSGEVGILAPAHLAIHQRERNAAEILDRAARVLRDGGVTVAIEEQIDDAVSAIIARAQVLGCDAIVMGRRGVGMLHAALLGSVSTAVIRKSAIPVIVIRAAGHSEWTMPPRILLAVDGSDSALRAATFAARLGGVCRSEVDLLHVQPGLTMAGAVFGSQEKLVEHWSGTPIAAALAAPRRVLDEAGIRCTEFYVASDDVHGAIVAFAREHACGLIAMGTRGLGPVTSLLLGSVAQGVLEHAPPAVSAVMLTQ